MFSRFLISFISISLICIYVFFIRKNTSIYFFNFRRSSYDASERNVFNVDLGIVDTICVPESRVWDLMEYDELESNKISLGDDIFDLNEVALIMMNNWMLSIYPEYFNDFIGYDDYSECWNEYFDYFESTDIDETLWNLFVYSRSLNDEIHMYLDERFDEDSDLVFQYDEEIDYDIPYELVYNYLSVDLYNISLCESNELVPVSLIWNDEKSNFKFFLNNSNDFFMFNFCWIDSLLYFFDFFVFTNSSSLFLNFDNFIFFYSEFIYFFLETMRNFIYSDYFDFNFNLIGISEMESTDMVVQHYSTTNFIFFFCLVFEFINQFEVVLTEFVNSRVSLVENIDVEFFLSSLSLCGRYVLWDYLFLFLSCCYMLGEVIGIFYDVLDVYYGLKIVISCGSIFCDNNSVLTEMENFFIDLRFELESYYEELLYVCVDLLCQYIGLIENLAFFAGTSAHIVFPSFIVKFISDVILF